MTAFATEILGVGAATFWVSLATFLRVGSVMAVLPIFGERSVPERVRLALAIGFTLIVGPATATKIMPSVENITGLPLWLGTEVLAGLALGIIVRIFVLVLQMAGSIAAQATSLSQIFGGAGTDPQPAMGHVLWIGGLALAAMLGLHVKIAQLLILSYDVFPVGTLPGAELITNWGIGRIGQTFALAFTLAAPFVIASLIYNVALGVINKAMPQLMVAFVGAPAITLGGLILLALTAPILIETWYNAFDVFLSNPFGAPK